MIKISPGESLNSVIRSYQSPATCVSFYRLPNVNISGAAPKFTMSENTRDLINATLADTGPAVLCNGLKNVMTT